MKTALLRSALACAVCLLATARADAQRGGLHVGYNLDIEDALLGAQGTWAITPRVALYPSFDYYFVDPGSMWGLNVDVKVRPPSSAGALYVGGGFNYTRASAFGVSGSDTGLNILVGLEGRRTRSMAYIEGKLVLGDGDMFQIVAGFAFR